MILFLLYAFDYTFEYGGVIAKFKFHIYMRFHFGQNEFFSSRCLVRSSRLEVFCKKGVLGNFAKFTGKHLCQRLWHRCFPVNFAKFPRTPFIIEHLWWLLLSCQSFVTVNVKYSKMKLIMGVFLLWSV